MFKKTCPRCGRKIGRNYEFCPYCGTNVKKERDARDFGILGKDDNEFENFGLRMPLGFNRIFNSLLKQIDKQFQELDRELGKEKKRLKKPGIKTSGISIHVSSVGGEKPVIKIHGFGPGIKEVKEQKPLKIKKPEITEQKARQFAKLPKEEAETKIKRLSDRLVYELKLPGVTKKSNVIINQLENSVEIKAFSKNKAYIKLIPTDQPIMNYKFEKEKLILEFPAE